MSMLIDVSITTVYSGGVLTIFQFFPIRLQKEANPLLFCACFKYVS